MEKTIKYHTRRYRCPECRDDRLTVFTDGTAKCIDGHVFEHEVAEEKPRQEIVGGFPSGDEY